MKSYVGIEACYFCGQDKGVLLDKRMKDSLPNKAIYDLEPCDECNEQQQKGITIVMVDDAWDGEGMPNNLGWVVVTENYIDRVVPDGDTKKHILDKRITFMQKSVWESAGFPT